MAAAAAFPDHPPSGPRARGRPRHWSWQFYRPIGDVKATTRRRSAQCTLCDLVLDDARPDRFVAHLAEACALAPPDLRTSVAEKHAAERAAMAAAGGGRKKKGEGSAGARPAKRPASAPAAHLDDVAPITAGALDDMLLTWLASARVPLASVDDPSFADFVYRLAPDYQPPSECGGAGRRGGGVAVRAGSCRGRLAGVGRARARGLTAHARVPLPPAAAAQLAMRQASLLSQSAADVAAAAATAAVVAAHGGPPAADMAPLHQASRHAAASSDEPDVAALLDMVRAGGGGSDRGVRALAASPAPPAGATWTEALAGGAVPEAKPRGGAGGPPTPAGGLATGSGRR
jgi:hypothetical protein